MGLETDHMSSLLRSRRTEYTISATAVSPTDEKSPVTTLRFTNR